VSTQDELEALIDRIGLSNLLEDVCSVCHEKADHLRTNWQDDAAAKAWEHAAKTIETAANRIKV
jgi:hypothetical protein